MNALYFLAGAGFGGHVRTALAIAAAMERRGHKVIFAVGESNTALIEERGFKLIRAELDRTGRFSQLEKEVIPRLKREGDLDVVHTFTKTGLLELARASKKEGVGFFLTICGGVAPAFYEYPRPGLVISLSEEVKDFLVKFSRFDRDAVAVIPARVDLSHLSTSIHGRKSDNQAEFRAKYELSESATTVMRIARVAPRYEVDILQGAEAVCRLRELGRDIQFVHIGYVQDQDSLARVRTRFNQINERFGSGVAVSAQDEATQAHRYLPMADVVMGAGRTAFEGMFAEKPTVVVGENGFSGIVGRDNIESLAYYNFSGRNVRREIPWRKSVKLLSQAIEKIVDNSEYAESIGGFGREYVVQCLSADRAAQEYEDLYSSFHSGLYPTDAEIRRAAITSWILSRLRRVIPSELRRRVNDRIYHYFDR